LALFFYVRLIALTAGTLVYLFLLALILGHRRPRNFERLLFFLVLALFAIYAGGLLEMNLSIEYSSPPEITQRFATSVATIGFLFLIPLVVHALAQYMEVFQQARANRPLAVLVPLLYAWAFCQATIFVALFDFQPRNIGSGLLRILNLGLSIDFVLCPCAAAIMGWVVLRRERNPDAKSLAKWIVEASLLLLAVAIADLVRVGPTDFTYEVPDALALVIGIMPGAAIIYYALKRNFLEYGAQRNLVYALSATVLALLYLALVHRVSGWLAPVFPTEATASVLLFVLIFLFEPLERVIGPALHRHFSERMSGVQRLSIEIQDAARQGNVAELIAFAERRIREEFGSAAVRISVPHDAAAKALEIPGGLGHAARLPLMKNNRQIGSLEAVTTGAYITGETSAALEFLAEQLPAMLDLCRLIEDKLGLERELADRERLALLGQMAASVSHNLRNPLSSMKTILQVQLEKPDLPFDIRHDCALVVSEIDRMSSKLTQLLKFAKPSVNGQRVGAVGLARQTAALFGRDAERRNVRLEFDCPSREISVTAGEEALNEVLSNLIVNAIEAQPNGGRVRVRLVGEGDWLEIRIEDDGPGISQEIRARMFQPFFTTKATGTGLGLSIVFRRVAEMGGEVSCESPVRDGRGTRFVLRLPRVASAE